MDDATPVVLVVTGESVRTVDRQSKEIMSNVLMKSVSFHTTLSSKKIDLYCFIEVDDRRNAFVCHVFICEKGVKNQGRSVYTTMTAAFDEARKLQGNPFRAQGPASTEPLTGTLADLQLQRKDLRPLKPIGAGQFGKVYLAEYSPTPTTTTNSSSEEPASPAAAPSFQPSALRAVKMLRNGASDDDKVEFLREAETMVELGKHEHLVQFMGIVVRRRPWLVVLEYCQYGDLSDVLRVCKQKNIQLRLCEQLHIAKQLASGMQYISSSGYVHMDLAARNVLLHHDNVVKVADFGLTHRFDEGKNYYKQRGVLKLSIRWLAIDSFDYKIFSEKSDVWSFAVTSGLGKGGGGGREGGTW